ncbi:MAG: 50S ribosomal protein L16, partial [Anaerolineales bacterium]|nr:50S ribosomal protein L16 [Anaerolineales bacterium]
MLMPKRVKYRKAHRGRMKGKESRGAEVTFGEFGLQALEPCWMTSRQIEAARRAVVRYLKRSGR